MILNYKLSAMQTDTSKKIIAYLSQNKAATAKVLIDYLELSPQAVFRQLKTLINNRQITKSGLPPRVFYSIKTASPLIRESIASARLKKIIDENYLLITSGGDILRGLEGFGYWCQKNSLTLAKTAAEYAATLKKYQAFRKGGLIDGMSKMRATFPQVFVDEMYYLDFYSLERFGKTKLGALLLYAKQSQNRQLMKELYEIIKNNVRKLIKNKKIDAVGFIPPTVSRKLQFQKEMERMLALSLPRINIIKARGQIVVPQKTLSRLADRVENVASTIFIGGSAACRNVLLIDDAVGSGATFNETAKKIKEKGLCSGRIIGLAITGSFKGFDVLSEI